MITTQEFPAQERAFPPWSAEEDRMIMHCIDSGIRRWTEIAARLPGRHGAQCRERWAYLEQQSGRLSSRGRPWTQHEDEILRKAQAKFGSCWRKIAALLPGRSESSIKSRWVLLLEPKPTDATIKRGSPLDLIEDNGGNQADFLKLKKGSKHSQNMASNPVAHKKNTHTMNGKIKTPDSSLSASKFKNGTVHGSARNDSAKKSNGEKGGSEPDNFFLFSSYLNQSPVNFRGTSKLPVPSPAPGAKIDDDWAPMSKQEIVQLADSFVSQEVSRQKLAHGVNISKQEQEMMRRAFIAGMEHAPSEVTDGSFPSDVQWEFDQSDNLDAMGFSFDEKDMANSVGVQSSEDMRLPPTINDNSPTSDQRRLRNYRPSMITDSTDGSFIIDTISKTEESWSRIPSQSELMDSNFDEMSLSLLNMSLDDDGPRDENEK